jgi:hypothetical protein
MHDPARLQLCEAQTHGVRKSTAGWTSTKALIMQAAVDDAATPLVGPAFSNSCLQLVPHGPGVVKEEVLFVVYDNATPERRRSRRRPQNAGQKCWLSNRCGWANRRRRPTR